MLLPPLDPQIAGCRFDPLSRPRITSARRSGPTPAELWAANNEFDQQVREFASDDSVKTARTVIDEARNEWAAIGSEAARDGQRWDSARAHARQSLQARLKDVLPRYDEIRALQSAHLNALFDKARPEPPVLEEPVIAPEEEPVSVFRVPFGQQRLGTNGTRGFETMDVVDRSFVRRDIGHLIVDADLASDPGGWQLESPWQLLPFDNGSVSASCGAAYAVPDDGRLLVTASLRNFYSRVTVALHDEWGFSWGRVYADVTIFIAVLRPDSGELLNTVLAERTLTSDGDNVTQHLPDIEPRDFHHVAVTEGHYEAGETVFVLAGPSVSAGATLNDMEAQVRALLWWTLEELTIRVV